MDKNHADDTAAERTSGAISVITDDHNRIRGLFRYFEQLDGAGPTTERVNVLQEICTELLLHAIVEEELLYPAARSAAGGESINEAQVEHDTAKYLILQLLPIDEDDTHFGAKIEVLREAVKHHMDEEEKNILPKLKNANLDLVALGRQLVERRTELRDQYKTAERLVGYKPVKYFMGKQMIGAAAQRQ